MQSQTLTKQFKWLRIGLQVLQGWIGCIIIINSSLQSNPNVYKNKPYPVSTLDYPLPLAFEVVAPSCWCCCSHYVMTVDKILDCDRIEHFWRPVMKQSFTDKKLLNCKLDSKQPHKRSFQFDKHQFHSSLRQEHFKSIETL